MNKILIDIDDVKLVLEALENSVDLVSNDAREAEKMYANVPTRLARVQGLVALEVAHEQAITALQNLLTNNALDRKAENARELGLDYEPAQQEPVCDKDPQGCWNVRCQLGKKCKNTPPAQKRPQNCGTGYCSCIECVMEPAQDNGIVTAGGFDPRTQRTWVGLTTKEIREWWASENGLEDCLMAKLDDFEQVARAIEAKLRSKNT